MLGSVWCSFGFFSGGMVVVSSSMLCVVMISIVVFVCGSSVSVVWFVCCIWLVLLMSVNGSLGYCYFCNGMVGLCGGKEIINVFIRVFFLIGVVIVGCGCV